MRSLSFRLLLSLFTLTLVVPVLAHDVTISGTQTFASLDGSSSDHDGAANGVFTVSDGNLVVNGVVNCNDDGPGGNSACAMAFAVSGNMIVNSGGALYAENRTGAGNGGAITLTVGGDLVLTGNAVVSSAAKTSSANANGGGISATVGGNVVIGAGSNVDSGAQGGTAGNISIAAGRVVAVDGNVLAGPSRTVAATRLTGVVLTGATGNQSGGQISISTNGFAEPGIVVGPAANVVAQGEVATGSVTLDACGIEVRGLVAAVSRDSAAAVTLRSGKSAVIDGSDLGATGVRMGRVRADSTTGTAASKRVDVFAADAVSILGPSTGLFAVSSNTGSNDPKGEGGSVRVVALAGAAVASGNAVDAGGSSTGNGGGSISISSAADALLNAAVLRAAGDHTSNNPNRDGGAISVRSYSGNVIWTNGAGDVRPVGSASNLPPADQGTIVLTACGTVNTTGSSFPVNGVATSMHPQTQTGACSPAAPSLPPGVAPLVTCNTPPVANDASASTNEDTTVTITLSGSDADGDSLTFSVVAGPANGTLGPIVPTGPTSATVNYTPNLNYNGLDAFVYKADDGNGGSDTATVTIAVAPVNDPPSFLAGPSVSANEDSGAQTYPNWATSISPGPADESAQSVTFTVTNNNNALFSVQPALSSNGTLTFTPAANAFGSATITVVAQDNGGTANGGNDTSAPQTSTVTIVAVNDEPSFTAGGNVTVNEDSGAYSAAWASSISAGPNESSQTVNFVASNDNNALFAAQPAVSSSGVLTFTPAANANGSATVSVYAQDNGGTANGGDDTSAPQTFTITVTAVNDAPSFTSGGNVSVHEDSGAYSAAWATNVSAGPADESGQTVSFSTANDNNALFSAQPSIAPDGTLTFTPAANAFGSATVTVTLSDNGGTANGGANTSAAQTFTITVNAVNDEPSFTSGGNVTVNEDSGAYSAAWATAISAGPSESQNLTFHTSNDNNALFSAQPSISSSGVLTFTPAANASGSATVTVYLTDDGGTANGGDNTSATQTFTITVNAVNDEPSFTAGGNVSVLEDSGSYSAAWATNISAGPNETQTVAFTVTNDNNALFSAQPAIAADGTLTFTVAANAFGSATVSVTLKDDGGTANGGDDTSATVTFTIAVEAVNDAPSFTAGGDVTVNEDSGAYSAAWASAISAGPNESGQTVAFHTSNNNNALFSVQPTINASGVLTFTPGPNKFGTATVTVYAKDNGGTANGGVEVSGTVTFTITVNAVNDPPAAANDGWETEGNTELRVDHGASLTPHVSDTTPSGTGVLDNDSDPVEGDPVVITGVVGCADNTAPYVCAVTGGTVTLESNGSFTFVPNPGATAGGFQYTLADQPSAGTPASATGTVTLTIHDMIWYVNGAAAPGGNGTSVSPFNNFASLNGAGDVDAAGHYIFVHTSAVSGSMVVEAAQKFWGEGVGLIIPRNLNGNGSPATLVAPGVRPTMTASGDAVLVSNVAAVEVAGLSIVTASGNGIDVTSSGTGSVGASIYGNTIFASGSEGIDINAGGSGGTQVAINATDVTAMGNGVDLSASDGNVVFAYSNGTVASVTGHGILADGSGADSLVVNGLTNVTVSGTTVGNGVSITAARFDANASTAAVETLSGGAMAAGTSADPVGGAAVTFSNVSGDLAFASLSAHGSTTGLVITGSGLFTGSTGMRITSGGGSVSAAAGVGVSVTNTTIGSANLSFTSVSATGGANGILLNNTGTSGGMKVLGSGSAGSGGTIQNATAEGISLVNTTAPSFSHMLVQNSGTDGISATNVNDFTLASSTVSDTAGATTHDGVEFDNVTGTVTITNSVITGSPHDNLDVVNTTGTSSFNISGSTFSNTHPVTGNSGINFEATGTAVVTSFSLTNSTLSGNRADGIQVSAEGTSDIQSTLIQNTTFSNNNIGADVTQNATAKHSVRILSNTFTGHASHAMNVFSGAGTPAGGVLTATVQNNVIGNAATAGSGSLNGIGIRVNVNGGADATVLVDGNTVRQTPNGRGIEVIGRNGNGGLDVTVTNNNVNPQDTSGFPLAAIFVQSNCVSVCNTVRSDVRNNVVPAGTTADSLTTFLALVESGASVLQLVDTPPASATCTAQLLSVNTGSASASAGCALIPGPISTP